MHAKSGSGLRTFEYRDEEGLPILRKFFGSPGAMARLAAKGRRSEGRCIPRCSSPAYRRLETFLGMTFGKTRRPGETRR